MYYEFCQQYNLRPLSPEVSTLCYYITWLTKQFSSAQSIRNYVSGVSSLHKQLGRLAPALTSYPVATLLRAVDLTLRTPPRRRLPVTPQLLTSLVLLTKTLGALGPPMKVALLLGYFGMFRVSNLAPKSAVLFDPSRHTCRGDLLLKPPGLLVLLKWSKTLQTANITPLIPVPHLPAHPLDPVQAVSDMFTASPTLYPDQPLLTYNVAGRPITVTIDMLAHLLKELLTVMGVAPGLYTFHSLRRGAASTAFHQGVDQLDIKRHGVWASDAFWTYISAPVVAASPVAAALARAVGAHPV